MATVEDMALAEGAGDGSFEEASIPRALALAAAAVDDELPGPAEEADTSAPGGEATGTDAGGLAGFGSGSGAGAGLGDGAGAVPG